MKTKLFKQLVFVCFALLLGGVNRAGAYDVSTITLPTTVLDLANPTVVTTNENWSGAYDNFYSIENSYLVANALIVRDNIKTQTWASNNSGGSANRTWDATDIFKGNVWYNATKGLTVQTEKVFCLCITNCLEIKSLVNGGSGSRSAAMDVYEMRNGGITNTAPVKTVTSATGNSFSVITTGETLEPSKEYLVVFYGTDAQNSTIAEVGFKIASTDPTPATVSIAETIFNTGIETPVTLKATVGGNPTPTVQWYQCADADKTSPTAIDGATAATYEYTPAAVGTYYFYCTATNENGEATSDVVTVNVTKTVAITATWPFELGTEGQTATIDVDGVFSSDFVDVAQMTYVGAASDSYNSETIKGTKLQPTVQATDNGSQYAKFTLKPKKGITFTPTSISFYAQRFGTDGNNKLHYYAESGTTKKDLGNVNPNRNGKGTGWSYYEHEISGIDATSENPFSLACYVYGLAADGKKQIGFANVVIKGVYTGEAEEETLYTITTSVTPEGAGAISQSPAGTTLAEGTAVTFSANSNAGYKFLNKWTVNGEEKEGETYSIEALSSDVNITAQFETLPVLTFAKPEGVVCINRAFPDNINTLEKGATYTLPNNYMYYKEGYTMTGWTDGTSNYNCGDTYTVNGDATLTPTFTENTVSIATRKSAVTVKFDFDQTTNGGRIVNIENNEDIFITTAEVDGQTIDVTLAINCLDNAGIDGKRGKVNNTSGNKAQVNPGSVFTIPAAKGSVITLTSDATDFMSTTFNGEAGEYNKKNATYTAKENGNVRIVATEDNMSYKSISVTYPAPDYALTTADADFYTLYLDYDATIPEGIEVYSSVLSEDKTVMTVNKVEGTVLPANTAVLLKSPAGAGEFTFEHATEAAATVETALLGVTETTPYAELTPEGKTLLTLGTKDGVVAFRKPYNAEGSLKANRAYLLLDNTTGEAKSIRVVIGGDDTTGISEVNAAKAEAEAPIYNMAGQRVAAGTKGLLIKNGKKYINK